jgi:hypothetical protein
MDRDRIILQRCLARAMRRAALRQRAEAARMRADLAAHFRRPRRDP